MNSSGMPCDRNTNQLFVKPDQIPPEEYQLFLLVASDGCNENLVEAPDRFEFQTKSIEIAMDGIDTERKHLHEIDSILLLIHFLLRSC